MSTAPPQRLPPHRTHSLPVPLRVRPHMRNVRRPTKALQRRIEPCRYRLCVVALHVPRRRHPVTVRIDVHARRRTPVVRAGDRRQQIRVVESLPHVLEDRPVASETVRDVERGVYSRYRRDGEAVEDRVVRRPRLNRRGELVRSRARVQDQRRGCAECLMLPVARNPLKHLAYTAQLEGAPCSARMSHTAQR